MINVLSYKFIAIIRNALASYIEYVSVGSGRNGTRTLPAIGPQLSNLGT